MCREPMFLLGGHHDLETSLFLGYWRAYSLFEVWETSTICGFSSMVSLPKWLLTFEKTQLGWAEGSILAHTMRKSRGISLQWQETTVIIPWLVVDHRKNAQQISTVCCSTTMNKNKSVHVLSYYEEPEWVRIVWMTTVWCSRSRTHSALRNPGWSYRIWFSLNQG